MNKTGRNMVLCDFDDCCRSMASSFGDAGIIGHQKYKRFLCEAESILHTGKNTVE